MLDVGYLQDNRPHILLARLNNIKGSSKHLDREAQCGFRNGSGCTDRYFHNQIARDQEERTQPRAWIQFLDLVKAFGKVPRELLWRVLTKVGVPDKMVSILKAMHKNVEVLFEVDDVQKKLDSIIGVKQGDLLGT